MAYFINQINNYHNQYKFNYLDHISTMINIQDNYWIFAIDLYLINDFNLPVNSIAADFYLPYQRIENISFNLAADQSKAKLNVEYNSEYSKIYTGFFTIDVSQNEFLSQDLENIKLNFSLDLFIDLESAKLAGSVLPQENLDAVVKETSEQRWDFEAYYTNTHIIETSSSVSMISGYSLPYGKTCIPINRQIGVSIANYSNLKRPINELATLYSTEEFQVVMAKVKYTYFIDFDDTPKTLEKKINVYRSAQTTNTVLFDENTTFDYEKNEVTFNPNGIKGFEIPKYSNGYYELELLVFQNDAFDKFVIRNNFNFIESSIEPYVSIRDKRIEDLNNFKEIIFND